ncbi:uncharacterized protein ARMOST_07775 [Armillaria ostoyae]|uniref:Protein kinase domain-containing protein n=1 Tax=Armillaria ostoyae TaxID=47428 RepID=A0A284R6U5_ARMOS|nr:uncharacterized protein ARMOST_07775 [Armillaria ostoyae]
MIHCLLKSLVFLHDRNIMTGISCIGSDIKIENTLVNHAHNAHWTRHDHTAAFHRSLRRAGMLTYAYIDFDIAIMFPPDAPRSECRLPYWNSWDGTNNWAVKDTAQGEHDYDPFAFDVTLLGFQFCQSFQHLPPYAPFLAPLLDMMVTHDYKRRFTASEALKFFEDMYPLLPEEQLQAFPPMLSHPEDHETFDRWKGLPPDLTRRWASYREPPLPRFTRILRYLCEYRRIRPIIIWGFTVLCTLAPLLMKPENISQYFNLHYQTRTVGDLRIVKH